MKRKVNVRYPLLLALIIYWLITFILLGVSLMKTHGHFGYPIDDTYIHMAMAKHLINDGFWGVSQNGFSSSTSSPLWTLLIAFMYKVLGINEWTPFALCLLCGSLIITTCYYLFKNTFNPIRLTIFLVFIVLLTPLPILTLTGMEHTMHGLFTIWLIYCSASYLRNSSSISRQLTLILLLAGLVTITRYEGLFLVVSITILFMIKKRFSAAFLTGVAGLLPLIVYGVFSISHGWYFFPNSILLKGNVPVFTIEGIAGFLLRLPSNIVAAPHILVLLIICLSIYLWCEKQGDTRKREKYLLAIFVVMTFLHMQFASIGWFYRYEAYLVLLGIVILVDTITSLITEQPGKVGNLVTYIVIFVLGILFVTPLAWRTARAFQDYPFAVMNIYDQQYQMGLFLNKYYSGRAIAANDIGAINYLADIKTLDLYGLGSIEVAQSKQNGLFDKNVIAMLAFANNVEIVIIYDSWFEGKIPFEWIEIGKWQIADNVICGDDTVSFYSPGTFWESDVTTNLREFSNQLPSTVKQSGIYTTP
jgi:4-amino-4-deoxy-L-arabinose transferase-like glycosyltransferase